MMSARFVIESDCSVICRACLRPDDKIVEPARCAPAGLTCDRCGEKVPAPMDTYTACSIVEGFSGEQHSEEEQLAAWQALIDSGACWSLQGWYGRTAAALIDAGHCHKAGA